MNVADRTKSINLELLEEMFQIEEKEKVVNPGKLIGSLRNHDGNGNGNVTEQKNK